MKTLSSVALFFLTFVAYGATTIIFDGQNHGYSLRDQNGEQQNEDYGLLSYSQETNDDRSESSSDVTENLSVTDNVAQTSEYENFQFTKNDATTDDGSATIGRSIVDKIAALDEIIVQEYQRNENLLDVENPLPVKKSVIKVTKQNFVSFRNAELQDLKSGRLEYLSIDPASGEVYVECAFDKLSANGTFKTNLAHTKVGRFVVDMTGVRSNVSSGFHGGRRVVKPAASGSAAVRVWAEDRRDVDAIDDAVREKYRDVLERAVSAGVYASAHAGLVARLKAEMKTPLDATGGAFGFAVDRTEDNVNVQMTVDDRSRAPVGRRPAESMSYARQADHAYQMRFDVGLEELRWTGNLTVTLDATQCARSRALELSADGVRANVVVFKSRDGRGCRRVEALVRVNGLRYTLDQRFSDPTRSVVDRLLPGLVERSLGAHVKDSLERDVCHNRVGDDNA